MKTMSMTVFIMPPAELDCDPGHNQSRSVVSLYLLNSFRDPACAGPCWLPRLLVTDAIKARRLHFPPTRDGAVGPDGKLALGAFDHARLRS